MFDYVNRQKNYKADRRSAAELSLNRSRGAPNLAIQALVATYAAGKAIVGEQAARAAVTEITDT